MKRFFESLTLLQLILLGFAAVILPLALAISIAIVQSEEFAANSREALVSVQTSTDTSRLLASRIRDLERSARQYIALEDEQILSLYRDTAARSATCWRPCAPCPPTWIARR